MENQKIKKQENLKEVVVKKSSELTENEIKSLEKTHVVITTKVVRNDYFNTLEHKNPIIKVMLSPHCCVELKQEYNTEFNNYPLTVKEFTLLKLKLNKGDSVNELKLLTPTRFLKGVNKNEKEYHRLDLFLPGKIIKSIYLSSTDLELLKADKKDFNWELVQTKLDVDFVENFEDLLFD